MLRRFFSYYKPHKKLFTIDFTSAIIVAILELAFPIAVQWFIDSLLPSGDWSKIVSTSAALLVLYLISTYLQYIVGYLGHMLGINIETDMRQELFTHVQRQSFRFFDNTKTGHVMSRITNDLFDIGELAHHGPEDCRAKPWPAGPGEPEIADEQVRGPVGAGRGPPGTAAPDRAPGTGGLEQVPPAAGVVGRHRQQAADAQQPVGEQRGDAPVADHPDPGEARPDRGQQRRGRRRVHPEEHPGGRDLEHHRHVPRLAPSDGRQGGHRRTCATTWVSERAPPPRGSVATTPSSCAPGSSGVARPSATSRSAACPATPSRGSVTRTSAQRVWSTALADTESTPRATSSSASSRSRAPGVSSPVSGIPSTTSPPGCGTQVTQNAGQLVRTERTQRDAVPGRRGGRPRGDGRECVACPGRAAAAGLDGLRRPGRLVADREQDARPQRQAADGQGPVGPRRAEPQIDPDPRRSVLLDEHLDRGRPRRVREREIEDVREGPAPQGARVEHHDEPLAVSGHAEPRSRRGLAPRRRAARRAARRPSTGSPSRSAATSASPRPRRRTAPATPAAAATPGDRVADERPRRDPGHRHGEHGLDEHHRRAPQSSSRPPNHRPLPAVWWSEHSPGHCSRCRAPSTRTGEVAVATTKEQAEAYDYEARRQATTLVTGRDEARTDPRRRINRVTAAGVLVGVLVMAGFGIAGFLGAGRGPALPESGAVLVAGSGDRYVVVDGRLHPALNLASALLVGGGIGRAGPPGGARRAAPRPARRHPGGAGRPAGAGAAEHRTVDGLRRPLGCRDAPPEVTVRVAAPEPAAGAVDAGQAVLATGPDGTRWMVNQGRRYRLADAAAQRVGLQRATPLALPAEILDLLPEGPPIAAPGDRGPGAPVAGVPRAWVAADVVRVQAGGAARESLAVLPDGVVPVSELTAALLVSAGSNEVATDPATAATARRSRIPSLDTPGWPEAVPQPVGPQRDQPLCLSTTPGAPAGDAPWPVRVSLPGVGARAR